ncbi:MAG: single-stranded-DNA-specific exonuclease RecJ [Bacteroidaceae bacterium]|nr:single-stranded-DNA-specific exonuclease RecJ [Candidatus Equimonas faecalis]MCQ2206349.1 single-stranded-DNA-specific exonuclease RecJ [Bacteroidaceae bacterium]
MLYEWNELEFPAGQAALASQLADGMGIHPMLGRLLVTRGITTLHEAKHFFRPQLTELHDPFLMNDMQVAVERLNQAVARQERVLVYGDYDVDGCTAVALVYKFLHQYYANIDYYIPDRYDEGYGVSYKGVDFAAETGVKLIIVLDCGIKAIDEIQYAKDLGIDFIICDHHVPDPDLPPAVAILNPKREDNLYPYTDLSGCGVGFKFMQGFALSNGIEFNKLYELLDLCAVSIASDIVPIMGENRVLAYHGLRSLNSNASIGLQTIAEVCGLGDKELTMNDIIFKIGPRINASGRMQNGKLAVALLVENDYNAARELANHINIYNEQRKDLDRQMTEEAYSQASQLPDIEDKKALVIYNEQWHKGIIGIVASRLTEQYYRPAVVLTRSEGLATGSARSVSGFDVYAAVQSCADLLTNFGGHTYAAGLSMKVEHVPEFTQRFEKYVEKHISDEQTQPTMDIVGRLDFQDIDFALYRQLNKFSPFGPGNPRPVFCTHKVFDYGTSKVVGRGQEHIKMELVDGQSNRVMSGIAFGQANQARYIKTRQAFDICYSIEENAHKRGEVQLLIEDIRPRN